MVFQDVRGACHGSRGSGQGWVSVPADSACSSCSTVIFLVTGMPWASHSCSSSARERVALAGASPRSAGTSTSPADSAALAEALGLPLARPSSQRSRWCQRITLSGWALIRRWSASNGASGLEGLNTLISSGLGIAHSGFHLHDPTRDYGSRNGTVLLLLASLQVLCDAGSDVKD